MAPEDGPLSARRPFHSQLPPVVRPGLGDGGGGGLGRGGNGGDAICTNPNTASGITGGSVNAGPTPGGNAAGSAIRGPHDFFHLFVEALRRSPELLTEYNNLKLRHDESDMATYRAAKDAFMERVLDGTHSNR